MGKILKMKEFITLNEHVTNEFNYSVFKLIKTENISFDIAKEHLEWWYDLYKHEKLLKTIDEFKDGNWFETEEACDSFNLISPNENFLKNNKIISYRIKHDGNDEYEKENVYISVYRFMAFDNTECLILWYNGTENDTCIFVTKSNDFSSYILKNKQNKSTYKKPVKTTYQIKASEFLDSIFKYKLNIKLKVPPYPASFSFIERKNDSSFLLNWGPKFMNKNGLDNVNKAIENLNIKDKKKLKQLGYDKTCGMFKFVECFHGGKFWFDEHKDDLIRHNYSGTYESYGNIKAFCDTVIKNRNKLYIKFQILDSIFDTEYAKMIMDKCIDEFVK